MTWIQRARREWIAAGAPLLLLACGGDDGPTGNTASIKVAVAPAGLVVEQGGSGSVTASLTRNGGFSGVVTLATFGLPVRVATTIAPAELSGTTASATLHMRVSTTATVGTYTATITATAPGVRQERATYRLSITPAYDYYNRRSPLAGSPKSARPEERRGS